MTDQRAKASLIQREKESSDWHLPVFQMYVLKLLSYACNVLFYFSCYKLNLLVTTFHPLALCTLAFLPYWLRSSYNFLILIAVRQFYWISIFRTDFICFIFLWFGIQNRTFLLLLYYFEDMFLFFQTISGRNVFYFGSYYSVYPRLFIDPWLDLFCYPLFNFIRIFFLTSAIKAYPNITLIAW